MRIRIRSAALVALVLAVGACSDNGVVAPAGRLTPAGGPLLDVTAAAAPQVRISEIHYDNTGTDADERIEISGPAGTDLTGWKVVLYNGNGGGIYEPTKTLSGKIPITCGTRGVVVLTYPVDGIQNGSPDGVALVAPNDVLIEFLSYEGAFTAVGGAANNKLSRDIGVSEPNSTPVGHSLSRNGADVWSSPAANTFGACNDNDEPPPPPPPPPPSDLPEIRFSEIHYDNFGTDAGESIEIEGPAGKDITGWQIVLYNGNGGTSYNTRTLSETIPATCGTRGVVVATYPQDGIQNGAPDGVALVNAAGQVVEFLSYEGTFTAVGGAADGMTSVDIGVSQSSAPVGQSLQRNASGVWEATASSFGACNGSGGPPPPPGKTISFSGRTPGDPALPVGFEDQLFATLRDGSGTVVPTTFTWLSETLDIASIDQNGVMRAVAAGTATFRATAEDGTTATFSLPTRVATASTTAQYAGNAEFGEPADRDAGDDFIIRHDQYTSSYNKNRGTPNWVSYNLEVTHFGPEDRCDCFTFDPALLAAGFTRYTTADYTGAGDFHGYGIDRGHLARSFDRTAGSLDNAFTFYFTNIIPQAADNNQGPWAILENHLGDLARNNNKEVYIIAGVAGDKGTVKNEGKITIPASVWKVAVIMPRNQGLGNADSYDDLEVLAVVMPNDPGIRNVSWETYKTTVDAVEALSGYDFLALLPDQVEIAVESNTKPPTAVVDGPYTSAEGSPVGMSGAGSTDPDPGDVLTHHWSFGDRTTGTGATVAHNYTQDGTYAVVLTVTDSRGLTSNATTTATVSNVAPIIGPFDGATLLPGETYAAAGSFTDPGADPWSATVDYGDGSGVRPLTLTGKSFSLSHTYSAPGIFTVTVRISDDDVTSSRAQPVTVLTPVQGVQRVIDMVEKLVAANELTHGVGNSLTVKLDAAVRQLQREAMTPAVNQLESFLHEVDALVESGRLNAANAAALRLGVTRVIRSVSS
jgi:DNA/RNA endonuclease G (NUC1)/PKD repeat protein